jgi:hemoglobin-like flavoprotein
MSVTKHPLFLAANAAQAVPVDRELIARLRASFARLAPRADELTTLFYGRLFAAHPALRPLFPEDMAAQRTKLAQTLAFVVASLEDSAALRAATDRLGRAHVGYGARAEHYPIVAETLVGAMAATAGKDWTEGMDRDWRTALERLAAAMLAATAV